MQAALGALDGWLLRTTLAGGVVLLAGALWMLLSRQPAQRQRIGELALLFALLVALPAALPSWWSISGGDTQSKPLEDALVLSIDEPAGQPAAPEKPAAEIVSDWDFVELIQTMEALDAARKPCVVTEAAPGAKPPSTERSCDGAMGSSFLTLGEGSSVRWGLRILGGAYVLLVGGLLVRCGFGYYGLWRYWRRRRPAPAHVIRAMEELEPDPSLRPRIGVCPFVHGPVSYGLWKPTILLPPPFCNEGDPEKLRWMLAHELTHLRRRDAWGCLLLAVGGAVYFHLPWFWWLKRQVRLAQEFVADAAAAKIASAVEYAQYLVSLTELTSRPTLASARAAGVFESHSDLYRRVHMLLRQRNVIQGSCPRWWTISAAASFLVLAACTAGVRVIADEPAQKQEVTVKLVSGDDDQKSDAKKDKKAVEKKGQFRLQLDDKDAKAGRFFKFDDGKLIPGDGAGVWKLQMGDDGQMRKKLDEVLKKLDQVLERLPEDVSKETRTRLEDVRAIVRKLRENPTVIQGFNVEELKKQGEAVRKQALERAKQGEEMARVAREKAEAAVESLRERHEHEIKAVREKIEAQLHAARAQAEAARLRDADEPVREKAGLKDEHIKKLQDAKKLEEFRGVREKAGLKYEDVKKLEQAIKEKEAALAKLRSAEDSKALTRIAPKLSRLSGAAVAGGRGRLGITYSAVDEALRSHLDIAQGQGLYVTEVFDPSPAWNSGKGMRSGDILVEFGGKKVPADLEKFRDSINAMGQGTYDAVVIRKGKRMTVPGIKLPGKEAQPKKSGDEEDGLGLVQEFDVAAKLADAKPLLSFKIDPLVMNHLELVPTLEGQAITRLEDVAKDLGEVRLKLAPQIALEPIQALTFDVKRASANELADLGAREAKTLPGDVLVRPGMEPEDEQSASKPRLGVQMAPVPEELASQIEIAEDRGLLVREVIGGSAADKAGFQKNDIVIEFANKPVTRDAAAFHELIKTLKPGTYTATVLRKGKELRIKGIVLPDAAKLKAQEKSRAKEWSVEGDQKEKEEKQKEKGKGLRRGGDEDDSFPGLAGRGAGNNKSTTVSVNNGEFTLTQSEDGKSITITGSMNGGKPAAKSIVIKEAGKEKKYKSVSEVPEAQRGEVEKLLGMVRGGGNNLFRFGGAEFGAANEAQLKSIEEAMKALREQFGAENPAFKEMEAEMKRLEAELKRLQRRDRDEEDR